MRGFLLLTLSLMTGCVASLTVAGCQKGWVEFTCNYKRPEEYDKVVVIKPNRTRIVTTAQDEWVNKGRFSLYHDTTKRTLKVTIKKLKPEDSGQYKCRFKKSSREKDEVDVEVGMDGKVGMDVEAGMDGKVGMDVEAGMDSEAGMDVEAGMDAEAGMDGEAGMDSKVGIDIEAGMDGKVGIDIEAGMDSKVGIDIEAGMDSKVGMDVEAGMDGKVGVDGKAGMDIEVEINSCQEPFLYKASTKTDITCNYIVNDMSNDISAMFFCKEKDFTCEDILTTKSPSKSIERFILTETDSDFSISISHVSPSDNGVYWCGVETKHYRAALRRIQLDVKATSTPSVFSSTQSTPTSPSAQNKARRSLLTIIIVLVVCAILLGLVLILVFIYKRIQRSKNTRSEEAQDKKEDRTYEEIQERLQEPDSGTAIKTIYTTANFHKNLSPDTHCYSNSSFKKSSVEVTAGDPYSTVNDNDQHPTYSTVNHPSGPPEDPCYYTLNKPQQP